MTPMGIPPIQRHKALESESIFFFMVLWLCVPVFAFAKAPVARDTAPLEIRIPAFKATTLTCGLKVLLLENDEMPLVSAELLIPGGNVRDPEGREGLAALMGAAMKNGGAAQMSPEAFDEALENKAASLSAASEVEDFSFGFKCLSGDLEEVLVLFADMILRPNFEAKRLETDRSNALDELSRQEDTPDNLTRVLFYRALMGNSPYGRRPTPKSLGGITREDVLKFYQRNLGPAGSVLVVTGRFDPPKLIEELEALFKAWKGSETQPKSAQAQPLGPAIYFFPKDVGQVFIRWGVLGLKRHDPKDIPLQVANYILGGSGFTSRLMHQIRSDRGLAYFVDSVALPYDVPGVYEVIGGTRPDAVGEYLKLMFQVMEGFGKEGPNGEELAQAQKSMVEEYAYNFESPFTLASYKASLDFHGYPDDYLKTYRDQVKAVTKEQATQAAQTILNQKDWVLVVCGPASLEKDLSEFGRVITVKSIFDPLPEKP